jgi:hypothetical protein
MAISLETIRKITIQGSAPGVDDAAASVDKLSAATQKLATASGATATVTDSVTKRQLSAADAYKRQTLAVVDGARGRISTRARQGRRCRPAAGHHHGIEHAERIAFPCLKRSYMDAGNASKALSVGWPWPGDVRPGGVRRRASVFRNWPAGESRFFPIPARLADQSKQLQQTTDSLQAYEQTFRSSGSSIEEADKALARANDTVGNAIDNIGDARQQLAAWNLDWRQLATIAPERRWPKSQKALLSIPGQRAPRARRTGSVRSFRP